MKDKKHRFVVVVFAALLPSGATVLGEETDAYGIDRRTPWTTSNVHGTPDPPPPYRTEPAFPHLKFTEPLSLTRAAGSDRLFVAERYGKIFSFPNKPDVEKADLLLDVKNVVYGITFHPKFATNGYFFVTYILDPAEKLPKGTRVSRFRAEPKGGSLQADLSSETVIIEWPSGGHNGGCIKFGPDGNLYIVTGDSSDIADEFKTGQDISDLPASLLRINVDQAAPGKPYTVPEDNPFVGMTGARPEIWAYGLRQLWRMSFDRETGELWGCVVGQDLWETVYVFEKGGNYGWSVTEGAHPFRPTRTRGPTPIIPPIFEHNHTEARSITGGFVYRGSRLSELVGAYIYGDYDTGKIWGLRYDGEKVTWDKELTDSNLRLVAFGEDHDGELYLVDHVGGKLHRLVPNPVSDGAANTFPRTLSKTGLFSNVGTHAVAPGVIPYSINSPKWEDGAVKNHWMALPGDSKIEFEGILYPQPAPGAPPGWKFPDGAVLVQTISMDMEVGNPARRRRLETRILHHERLAGDETVGDQIWHGYTYIWNDGQTDAVLLESKNGLDRTFTLVDPEAPTGKREQTWHFPSRAECTVCHNIASKYGNAMTTFQMNRDHDYGDVVDNQLRTFEHIGLFEKPLPARPEKLSRLVEYTDESVPLDKRALAYLHSNCGFCHRKWGGGNADFFLLALLGLDEMGIAGTQPGQGTFEIVDAEILAPGDPYRSTMLYRMSTIGGGRMPRLGSTVVDEDGVRLIQSWIAAQAPVFKDADTQRRVAKERASTATALERLRRAGASEDRAAAVDALLETTSGALRLVRSIDDGQLGSQTNAAAIARATKNPEPHIRDLFERYLPEDQRTRRLGSVIDPAKILSLTGDVDRGSKLFFDAPQIQCRNCHKIQGRGEKDVGPDLGEIGKKYELPKILDSILEPSKEIDPKWVVYLVQTKLGEIHTGLLIKNTPNEVLLKDTEGKLTSITTDNVALLLPQQRSLMPDLLVRDMTAQQVADILAFFVTLRGNEKK